MRWINFISKYYFTLQGGEVSIKLQKENQDWINDFVNKYKRPPRILHISNVANNAYNNAKLLNKVGLVNHVIAYNDYYAMACPEWEDADFTNEVTDMWHPEWSSYNLNDFIRPRWFAQGDLSTCISYLMALCDNKREKAESLFITMANKNKCIYVQHVKKEMSQAQINLIMTLTKKIFLALLVIAWRTILRGLTKVDSRFNTIMVSRLMRIRKLAQSEPDQTSVIESVEEKKIIYGKWEQDDYLVAEFKKEFPERKDQLSEKDFINYFFSRPGMRNLLNYYDIVIGYATEGVYPMMFGKPYFVFEHGTIRDIPYAQDPQARLCALTYRKAKHAFVTNFDCVPSADFLIPGKYSVINHPYDEDQPLSINENWKQEQNGLLQELQANMILFHPTRQDWVEGTGYADKANDIFLRAFASLRQKGLRLGLVCCEWGANIDESKKLIDQYGVSEHVRWMKPLGVIAYTRMCKMANIVVDQFKLGGFGGVTFKALAAGTPVMAYVNVQQISSRYAELPPVINCQTEAEITHQLSYWYNRRSELEELGMSGRAWMKKFHNKSETVNIQIEQFRRHFPVN